MKNKLKSDTDISDGEFFDCLQTNRETGLTEKKVIEHQQKFGLNILNKQKKTNFFVCFVKSILFELMSLLLFITGIIAFALAIYENVNGSPHYVLSYIQTGVLLSIVFINALFETIQEIKSSNAIKELRKMSSPTSKVLRNGKVMQIDSVNLTIGDIIIVAAGDTVNADAILISDSHLKISESILTGESTEVLKDADFIPEPDALISDQRNKIFAGTNVLNGKGYGIVYAISNKTEIGKIADLLDNNDSVTTPLQLKLKKLGKVLGIFGILITVITFIFSFFVIENIFSPNTSWIIAIQSSLLLAISLAAAAIPEGLNAIVTIVLSIGVKKMTKKNVLIKKLPSVETLGSTSVICSDKTGTLTMNKMTVVKLWAKEEINNDFSTDNVKTSEYKKNLLIKASLCTDGIIDENNDVNKRNIPIGDPTEIAILELTLNSGISVLNIKNENKRIGEIPFDSDRKLMSSVNKINGKRMLIVKGAPDVIFSKCKNFNLKTAEELNNNWSNDAIRVLAIAQKEIYNDLPEDLNPDDYENNLEFIGLIGMVDPPREGIKKSINECIFAGIKPIMITGDHLNTAFTIAKKLGIVKNEKKDLAITGAQLDAMSEEELNKNIEKYSVYARVSPENKIRIVKAWQLKNQVVAMTGDGVNDAPALKAADIGCAMGITGTDVSKQAADMILMDDNFSTIVEAVKLGRNIYENIRRITKFLLSSNVTGVFTIVIGMIIFYLVFELVGWGRISSNDITKIVKDFGTFNFNLGELAKKINEDAKFETTITTVQILINNIIIETLPGVALGTQITISDLMNKKPRLKNESIFADNLQWKIISIGIIHGILTVTSFTLGVSIAISNNAPLLKTYYGSIAAFLTLTIGGVLKSISMCSSNMFYKTKWNESKWIYLTSIISLILIVIIIAFPKLSSIVAERPILGFESHKYNLINNLKQDTFNEIIKQLSGNMIPSNFASLEVYLCGFLIGISTFVFFESYKFIELKLENSYKKIQV